MVWDSRDHKWPGFVSVYLLRLLFLSWLLLLVSQAPLPSAMGLEVLWCFGLACLDIHALRLNKYLHNHILLSLVTVGDWVTAILALAGASSSAGVMILFVQDSKLCKFDPKLSCNMFQVSIAFAFISWFLLAISSHTLFWLLASLS